MSSSRWPEQGRSLAAAGILSGVLLAAPDAARADQIDGEWCNPEDGRHLEIQGPTIITPTGTTIRGVYDRHNFAYIIPPGDPGAGGEVVMRQLSDDLMRLTPPGGGEEEWRRCDMQTS